MDFSAAILLIFITALSASYGWGMRGAVIGGEKGAMIPGALIGISVALFSGIDVLRENWMLLGAVGSLAMGFGGFEPYAETAGFTLHTNSPSYNPKKAFVGLAIKGANWFGLFGTFFGMMLTAILGDSYRWYDFVIIAVLQVVLQLIGIQIFNKPYDREKGIRPKDYFSVNSREEWGGNLLFLVGVLLYATVRGDELCHLFALAGIVAGGLGWYFSWLLCKYTAMPLKNGKYILGKLRAKGYADCWKIMEFSFGAIGGLAFSLVFVGVYPVLKERSISLFSPMIFAEKLDYVGNTLAYIVFFLALVMPAFMLLGQITEKKDKKKGILLSRIFELTERAVYYSAMLCLVLLGSKKMATIVLFPLTLWVLIGENVFEQRLKVMKSAFIVYAGSVLAFIASVVLTFRLHSGFPLWAILVLYTAVYIISDFLFFYCDSRKLYKENPPKTLKDKLLAMKSVLTVHAWFWLLSGVMIAVFLKGYYQ